MLFSHSATDDRLSVDIGFSNICLGLSEESVVVEPDPKQFNSWLPFLKYVLSLHFAQLST